MMTVDDYHAWVRDQPGRYELVAGIPVELQSELTRHTRVKRRTCRAFEDAISAANLSCEAWTGGASVRIDEHTLREPGAVLTCGESVPDDVLEVRAAVIVVEVLSPGNGTTDKSRKLADYLRVPTIHHYRIVDPEYRMVIHHRLRHSPVLTEVVREGSIRLDPPGLSLELADLFPAL